MAFTDSNDVGIGTTTPEQKLHVGGTIQHLGNPDGGANVGIKIISGLFRSCRTNDSDTAIQIYTKGNNSPNVQIMTGGDASFDGKLYAHDYDLEALPSLP